MTERYIDLNIKVTRLETITYLTTQIFIYLLIAIVILVLPIVLEGVGEELFAAGAYSNAGTAHLASLQAQDILRWIIILILLGGSALKLIGII